MNKLEFLQKINDMLHHNILCYSTNYLMNEPKKEYVKQWEDTQEKIGLIEEIIEDVKQKESDKNMSFTKEQILRMYPNVKYHVVNSNGGLLAGTVELDDAKRYAQKYKKEYLNDPLNRNMGVYVYDKNGTNVYVAIPEESLEDEETEELE